jgi:type I restriction enzyme S subunit
MPSDWTMRGVDDVRRDESDGLATGPFGSSVSSKFFQSHGIPLIRGSNLSEAVGTRLIEDDFVFVSEEKAAEFPRAIARAGDLVFTCWGTIGQVGLIDHRATYDRYLISNKQMKLSPNPAKADSLFLYYLFQSPEMQAAVSSVGIGSSVPGFNLGQLRGLRFPLPPLIEQRAIADILGALDDKIEQNRRTGRALEGLARATFKAWFVDFEPVKAKAVGAASFPGLPPAAFAVLPDRLTDSPLGPVPQGWDTPAFSEIVKQSSERVGTASVPAYSSTNEGLRPRNEQFKKDLAKSFAKNLLIRSGDLVFGNSREILNFGVMYEPAGSVSQVYKVFRPHSEVVTPRYLEMMIRECSAFYRQIIRSTTRDNQGIMADFFLQLPLLVPPEEFRDAYSAVEKPVREMIDHLQAESAKLAALRDYLLPRLLSGQVRVRSSQAEAKG